MTKLKITRFICSLFPPAISQKIRDALLSIKTAEKLATPFQRSAFTGGKFTGNTNDFHAYKFYVHGYFDWRNVVLCRKILSFKPGDIIEVGANIGTETVSFADINKTAQVHAFEPLRDNFESLVKLKLDNDYQNLQLYDVLVSNETGTASFKIPGVNKSGSGHITSSSDDKTEDFELVTLDHQLAHIKSCSSLVIDVEGFEYQVIKGGESIIDKYRPYMIIEVNAKYLKERANITVSFLHDELSKMGYEMFYIEKLGLSRVQVDDFLVKTNKNWICIPKESLTVKSKLSRTIFWNAFNPFMKFNIF